MYLFCCTDALRSKRFALAKRFLIAFATLAICLFVTGIVFVLIIDEEKKRSIKKRSLIKNPQPPPSSEKELEPLDAKH